MFGGDCALHCCLTYCGGFGCVLAMANRKNIRSVEGRHGGGGHWGDAAHLLTRSLAVTPSVPGTDTLSSRLASTTSVSRGAATLARYVLPHGSRWGLLARVTHPPPFPPALRSFALLVDAGGSRARARGGRPPRQAYRAEGSRRLRGRMANLRSSCLFARRRRSSCPCPPRVVWSILLVPPFPLGATVLSTFFLLGLIWFSSPPLTPRLSPLALGDPSVEFTPLSTDIEQGLCVSVSRLILTKRDSHRAA